MLPINTGKTFMKYQSTFMAVNSGHFRYRLERDQMKQRIVYTERNREYHRLKYMKQDCFKKNGN